MKNDPSIYDAHAGEWWSGRTRWLRVLHNMVPARLELFDPLVGTWLDKDVLDLGCGGGFLAEALARRGSRVVGVDPSGPAIAAAAVHAGTSGLQIDYRVGAGEDIPLADASVDIVVCVDVLEHVVRLDRVLGEIRRVIRPGGLLLFDTINRNWLATFVIVTLGEKIIRLLPAGTHDPALFIKPADLDKALSSAGFRRGAMQGFGPRGVDMRLDVVFGRHPSKIGMYVGHAYAL